MENVREPDSRDGIIHDLFPRRKPGPLARAVANVLMHRLLPEVIDRHSVPFNTAGVPSPARLANEPLRCFLYPMIPDQGPYWDLTRGMYRRIAAAHGAWMAGNAPEPVLLIAWRRRVADDRAIHVWTIPAEQVAIMAARLSPNPKERNVGISRPDRAAVTFWFRTVDDPNRIRVHGWYRRWNLTHQEEGFIAAAEEVGPPERRT